MTQSISRAELHEQIGVCLPMLRRYALFLCRDRTLADDLVQDAAMRAIDQIAKFAPGSNFKAWISTILRNGYLNELRGRRWLSYDGDAGVARPEPSVGACQETHMEVQELKRAFDTLQAPHRQALLLVGASEFTYEEAAHITGVAVGTMKSRVWRARAQLNHVIDQGLAIPPLAPANSRRSRPRGPARTVAARRAAAGLR
jgi:RNA polymerase sigma-70 factor (ECF subfamily)